MAAHAALGSRHTGVRRVLGVLVAVQAVDAVVAHVVAVVEQHQLQQRVPAPVANGIRA